MRQTGVYQTLGDLTYFIPHPLPPSQPDFQLNTELMSLYGEASFALGQLNEMSLRLPDPERFIKAYIMKEALLSSAIEGIQTTLLEVWTSDLEKNKPNKETQLVLNYTRSLDAAILMLKTQKLPISSRVILKAHEILLSNGEGDGKTPGQYRSQSVRVGDLVPPPAPEIPRLISDLECYVNESSSLPPLIRAGLVHVQFETIHPFLDGNGRIGRLLIVLMLIDSGLLNLPILYPSYAFKKYHLEYYQRLNRVRTEGDFEGWILYYLKAISESAQDAYLRAKAIEDLEQTLNQHVQKDALFRKMRETAQAVLGFLFVHPVTGISEVSHILGKAYNTVGKALSLFTKAGIVSERIVHKKNRIYYFTPYLSLLEKEFV